MVEHLIGPGEARWASLSSSSSILSIEQTSHHIEIDRPQLVIEELVKLVV